MGLILDTSALSALAEGEPGAVREIARSKQLAIPVIVLGEYRFGISQSRHRSEYERWLQEMIGACAVLDVNDETTVDYAAIRAELKGAGTPIPSNDVWIAALCRQHRLPILSRDKHFDLVDGLTRLNY